MYDGEDRMYNDEDKEVFDLLVGEAENYNWEFQHRKHKLYVDGSKRLVFFPREGGVLIINQDGTWAGDIAPFCD